MSTKKAKPTGTAVAKWDEELAKQAEIAAGMEANVGGGQFFSLKGGILSLNDQPMPNNEMAVIILDHILENVYYEGAYNPDVISPPTCFAFGRNEADMAPHKVVVEAEQAQHGKCEGCPMNEWGTAERGRGKACRNTRRLAMIPAGSFSSRGEFKAIPDEDHFETVKPAMMKLPLTSVTGYATFVKQVAGALRRPPHGIITRVKVVPDPKTQFKVVFEPIANVPDNLMGTIMKRHDEMSKLMEQPYALEVEEQAQPARRPTAKSPAKGAKKPAKPVRRAAR